jgi:hypothetical protein
MHLQNFQLTLQQIGEVHCLGKDGDQLFLSLRLLDVAMQRLNFFHSAPMLP